MKYQPIESPAQSDDRCQWPICAPGQPQPDLKLSANAIALYVFAGLGLGEAIAFLIDRLVDGPGILAIFGL